MSVYFRLENKSGSVSEFGQNVAEVLSVKQKSFIKTYPGKQAYHEDHLYLQSHHDSDQSY